MLHVPSNTSLDKPVHVLYLSSSAAAGSGSGSVAASAPRLLAVLEESACAELIEEFAPLEGGAGSYFANAGE